MLPERFCISMINTLRRGPYDAPYLSGDSKTEWLIVERTGPDGSILMVSEIDIPKGTAPSVPSPDLRPKHTMVALLAECGSDDRTCNFLALRNPLPDVTTRATFFPTEGSLVLRKSDRGIRLLAFGRCAHSRGFQAGQGVLHDVPAPPPYPEGAFSWHFDATEISAAA